MLRRPSPIGTIGAVVARWLPDAAVVAAALAVLAYYARLITAPLPLYAWDEGGFLICALFSPETVARNGLAAQNNGVFLGLIRMVASLTADYVVWIRMMNVVAYFGGLLAIFAVAARALPQGRWAPWLILALAFPYYRFVVTDLPEGCYVGVLGALGLVTARLWRPRPVLFGLAAGALAAALVLIKPHGLAAVAGLGGLIALDAAAGREWRRPVLRLLAGTGAFFAAGNLFQWAAGQPVASPLTFFVGRFYGNILADAIAPGAVGYGLFNLAAMDSTVVLLAGLPLAIGGFDLARRWLRARGPMRLEASDLVFVLLAFSLFATLSMVAIYTMKMAAAPSEMKRLWGRYFEFFVPMLWLAAAPAVTRWETPAGFRGRAALAAIPLLGLGGLLLCFRAGVVLMPWDATAVTAFFHADAERFALAEVIPFRPLAVAATLAVAAGLAAGLRISRLWPAYVAALGLLSTVFDASAMTGMSVQHAELAADLRAARPVVAAQVGPAAALVSDGNDAALVFLGFHGRPTVRIRAPDEPAPALPGARLAITVRTPDLQAPEWTPVFHGRQVGVFTRGGPP